MKKTETAFQNLLPKTCKHTLVNLYLLVVCTVLYFWTSALNKKQIKYNIKGIFSQWPFLYIGVAVKLHNGQTAAAEK